MSKHKWQLLYAMIAKVDGLEDVLKTIVEADGYDWESFRDRCISMQAIAKAAAGAPDEEE